MILALLSTTVMAAETVDVFSTSGCGCCIGWMKHLEEAGFEATEWTYLSSAYSSPGISQEIGHYFLARGLTDVGRGDFEPEHEEAEMELRWVPVQELAEAVLGGGPVDGHLATAVLLATSRGLAGSSRARDQTESV